jgi:amino acid transporter
LYGFDTAGSLAEETHDPRRCAPRAILRALGAAGVAGLLVLLFALMSIPDLAAKTLSSADGGLSLAVKELLGSRLGRLFLCDVAFAIFVCTLAVHSGSVRVVFAMARDHALPCSRALARVSQSTQTPVIPAVLTGAGATTILLVNLKFPKVVELVTAIAILWANLAYLLVIAALLRKRLEGWPEDGHLRQGRQAFALGKYGFVINVLALIWSLFMVVNVGWPRPEVYGQASRLSPVTYTATVIIAGAAFFWFARPSRIRSSEQLPLRSVACDR